MGERFLIPVGVLDFGFALDFGRESCAAEGRGGLKGRGGIILLALFVWAKGCVYRGMCNVF